MDSPSKPLVIKRQEEVMLKLEFKPLAVGSFPAEIVFDSDDPGQRSLHVPVDGRGVQSDWSAAPRALAFRTLLLDQQSAAQPITLQNISEVPILVYPARLEGPGADQFRVHRTPETPEPLTLNDDESVTYSVSCHPSAPGQHVASLVLDAGARSTGPPISIALAATAVAATLAHPTVEYSFGDVVVGSTSKPREFPLALVPPGLPQHIRRIESSNSLFVVDQSSTTMDLDPGAGTSIRVQFHPGAAGEATAVITATVSGGLGPLVVARLHGRGVAGVPILDDTCAVAGGGPGSGSGSGSGWWPMAGAMVMLALRARRRRSSLTRS